MYKYTFIALNGTRFSQYLDKFEAANRIARIFEAAIIKREAV
jgi:hypothetical protein